MIKFNPVLAETTEFNGVESTGYLADDRIIDAVKVLNSVGLSGIVDQTRDLRVDDTSIPLSIINPVSERSEDPLSDFEDGVVVRTFGAACGQRVTEQKVLSSLVSEVTGKPVINVPLPDRDWHAEEISDKTKNWSKFSNKKKQATSIDHLDNYAQHVLESLEKLIETEDGVGVLSFSGESIGATLSLSFAHLAKHFDLNGVSIAALPNNETRHLYRELFIRDFMKSGERMHDQVTAGAPKLTPLIEALGFQDGPKSPIEELTSGAPYILRDLFGVLPIDPKMRLYKNNRALTRALTVPTSLKMIERLNKGGDMRNMVELHAAFFKDDLVARPDAFKKLAGSRATPSNAEFYLLDGDHAATNNPYIIGHMATKLLSK